jgi:uncharacterized protein YfbU (UPF0304 family)
MQFFYISLLNRLNAESYQHHSKKTIKTAGSNLRLKDFLDAFDKDMDEITRYSIELFGDYTAAAGSEIALELENVHCNP